MKRYIGAIAGSLIGFTHGGVWGALMGAYVGDWLQKSIFGRARSGERPRSRRTASSDGAYERAQSERRTRVFCASAAAMLAKLAKADGHVTRDEIACVERVFARLGFSPEARRYAIEVFRRAKDDARTVYEYASEFAGAVRSVEVREFFYGLLWDLACADGVVSSVEQEILRKITYSLGIRREWFDVYAEERFGGAGAFGDDRETGGPSGDGRGGGALDAAYRALGVDAAAGDAELKRAYREMAKRYHPDTLRAQGLPDEMIGKATERMKEINAAWAEIRRARGL